MTMAASPAAPWTARPCSISSADIRDGKVDVVVTYKIDRLTRSLADFAKITEIFEARGVSFVSVTQQFNTTTSMGRLTLNVLLSFAQFEREVDRRTHPRQDRRLEEEGHVDGRRAAARLSGAGSQAGRHPEEAETVRHIFRRYVALGSVRLLKEELEAHGITGKCWTSTSGRRWGGKPIARGALYLLLQNRIYRGEIVHKDRHYPGEHAAIIDPGFGTRCKPSLPPTRSSAAAGARSRNPSLLAGLLFDPDGNRMTPTHAVKNGRRYRYYVSHPLITQARATSPGGVRVPALEIEQLVTDRIRDLLGEPASLIEATEPFRFQAVAQRDLLQQAAEIAASWSTLQPIRISVILTTLVQRIDLHSDRIELHTSPQRLTTALGIPLPPGTDHHDAEPD